MSKMSLRNRILSVVLSVCMMLTLLPWIPMKASAVDSNGDNGCEHGAHNYDEVTLLCPCGAVSPDAVTSVTIGDTITYYVTLDEAVQVVKDCTADDKAVVTMLKSIELDSALTIESGVFTIDLNDYEISINKTGASALKISGAETDVVIMDSGTLGKITSRNTCIHISKATVTIMDCEIMLDCSGSQTSRYGVYACNSTVTITDCEITIYGDLASNYIAYLTSYGVYADNSTVTVSGCTFEEQCNNVRVRHIEAYASTMTVTDSYISGATLSGSGGSKVTVSGCTVDSDDGSIWAESRCTVVVNDTTAIGQISVSSYATIIVNNTTIIEDHLAAVEVWEGDATISGGCIYAEFDIAIQSLYSTVTLSLNENGVGTTFPGGIALSNITLNAILGEGSSLLAGRSEDHPSQRCNKNLRR